jgi:Golgi phosphoprotein 3
MGYSIHLHEEIMLLALRDREGTVAAGAMYQYAIGGAILAELLLSQHIRAAESGKKTVVKVVNPSRPDDPIIDECLSLVRNSKKPRTLQHWVSRFAGVKKLPHRVAEQLCRRGILRADEDKVLLFFTRKVYPEVNPERISEAIFTDSNDLDPNTVVLVSLANSVGLLNIVFDKKELKKRRDRIEKIVNGEIVGKAATEAIQAVQAAIMSAVIIPTVVTR